MVLNMTFFLRLKIELHIKYKSCIFTIKQVMAIFVCQDVANYQLNKVRKFLYIPQFLDFSLIFCVWALDEHIYKYSRGTWDEKLLLSWFLGATESVMP